MKKRVIMLTALAVAVCGIFAGCSKTGTETKSSTKSVSSATSSAVQVQQVPKVRLRLLMPIRSLV